MAARGAEVLGKLRGSGLHVAAGLGTAAMAGNVVALVFTVVFARILGAVGYGTLAALISAFLIVAIAGSALQVTIARETSIEIERADAGFETHINRWMLQIVVGTALIGVVGILARVPIADLLGVSDDPWAAAAILPSGAIWLLLCVQRGVLQGLASYRAVGLSIVGEAVLRLLCGLALVASGLGVAGAFYATGASIAITCAILVVAIRKACGRVSRNLAERDREARPRNADWRLGVLIKQTWPAFAALGLIAVLQNSDVIMVKRLAESDVAGAYAADAVAAKVIVWIAIGLGMYVVPESARRGFTSASKSVLYRAVALIGVAGLAMVAIYASIGEWLISTVFGNEFAIASDALPVLGLAMTALSIVYLASQFLLAVERYKFLSLLLVVAAVQIIALAQFAAVALDAALVVLLAQLSLAAAITLIEVVTRKTKS